MAKRKSKLMFPAGSQMPEMKKGGGEPHMQTHFPVSTCLGEKCKDRSRVNDNEDCLRRKKVKRFSCKNTELCFRGKRNTSQAGYSLGKVANSVSERLTL